MSVIRFVVKAVKSFAKYAIAAIPRIFKGAGQNYVELALTGAIFKVVSTYTDILFTEMRNHNDESDTTNRYYEGPDMDMPWGTCP